MLAAVFDMPTNGTLTAAVSTARYNAGTDRFLESKGASGVCICYAPWTCQNVSLRFMNIIRSRKKQTGKAKDSLQQFSAAVCSQLHNLPSDLRPNSTEISHSCLTRFVPCPIDWERPLFRIRGLLGLEKLGAANHCPSPTIP